MRTVTIVFASFLVAAAGLTPARAATTTHSIRTGSGAFMHVSFFSDDGCIGISMFMDSFAAVTRPDGTTSAELDLELVRDDFCQGISEFAFTTVPLTNEFQLGQGGQTASLNVSAPIQTFDFDGVSRTRPLVANVQFQSVGQSLSGISSSRFNGGGVRIVQSGHSTSSIAEATGQISLDGLPLSPDNASIETFMNLTVDVTR